MNGKKKRGKGGEERGKNRGDIQIENGNRNKYFNRQCKREVTQRQKQRKMCPDPETQAGKQTLERQRQTTYMISHTLS